MFRLTTTLFPQWKKNTIKSQNMRKLKPTKRPRRPPHSAMKDPAGYASFSLLMMTFGLVNIIFTVVVGSEWLAWMGSSAI